MRSAIVLCLSLFGIQAFSQYVMNLDNAWKIGEEFTTIPAIANTVSEGPAGAEVVWDFRHLVPNGSPPVTISFHDPADVAGSQDFPGATIVEQQSVGDQSIFQYWSGNQQQMFFMGVQTSTLSLVYIDPELTFLYPFTFGNFIEDGFVGQAISGNSRIDQLGSSQTLVDAYGTLVMPDATWENVLRVVSLQNVQEQFTGSNNSSTSAITTLRYSWYAEGVSYPILSITYMEIFSQGQVQQGKAVFYQPGEPPAPVQSQWMPHVTADSGGFESTFYFKNQSGLSDQIKIVPFESNGSPLSERNFTLQPGELRVLTKNELFNTDPVSHFRMEHSENIKVTTGYKMADGSGASAHVHESAQTGTSFRIYSGEPELVFDGMALVNTSDSNVTVLAIMKSASGNIIDTETLIDSLPPGVKTLALFDQVFPESTDGLIEIQTTGEVSALFLRGSRPGTDPAYLYTNLPQPEKGDDRWIPHVTSATGGFETKIHIHNPTNSESFAELKPFLISGDSRSNVVVRLGAGETIVSSSAELFGDDPVSHIEIVSVTDVIVSAAYRSSVSVGASAHLHETSRIGNEFWIYPGEWDLVFDGMALVNTAASAARVTATQYATDGSVLGTVVPADALDGKAKLLAVFGGLFQETPRSIIKIESTQPSTVLFLRGSPVATEPAFLYPNQPLPE